MDLLSNIWGLPPTISLHCTCDITKRNWNGTWNKYKEILSLLIFTKHFGRSQWCECNSTQIPCRYCEHFRPLHTWLFQKYMQYWVAHGHCTEITALCQDKASLLCPGPNSTNLLPVTIVFRAWLVKMRQKLHLLCTVVPLSMWSPSVEQFALLWDCQILVLDLTF